MAGFYHNKFTCLSSTLLGGIEYQADLFDAVPSTAYQFTHASGPVKKKDETIMTMMDGTESKQEDEEDVKNDYDANFSFLEEGKEEVLEEELIKKVEKEENVKE